MDFNYIEETAPLTEEQWERIIAWHRKRAGRGIVQGFYAVEGLTAMKEFHESMERLHALAGHSQEQIDEISQAILDMAKQEEKEL